MAKSKPKKKSAAKKSAALQSKKNDTVVPGNFKIIIVSNNYPSGANVYLQLMSVTIEDVTGATPMQVAATDTMGMASFNVVDGTYQVEVNGLVREHVQVVGSATRIYTLL